MNTSDYRWTKTRNAVPYTSGNILTPGSSRSGQYTLTHPDFGSLASVENESTGFRERGSWRVDIHNGTPSGICIGKFRTLARAKESAENHSTRILS